MLSDNIRNARMKKGWSQQELADKYNLLVNQINKELQKNYRTIGRTAVTHWETGRYTPDIDSLPFLCELLEVSADDLLDINDILAIQNNNEYKKEFKLDNGLSVSITIEKPWDELTEAQQKEIMDSVIEESIKIKKEANKKDN